jgi:CheY-like chemotaxis protein
MLLEKNGYEVLEASGGDEGLKLFRSHPIDAVVLDYQMRDEWRRGCRENEAHQIPRADHAAVRLRTAAEEQTEGSGHLLM